MRAFLRLLALVFCCSLASAQTYPTKEVTVQPNATLPVVIVDGAKAGDIISIRFLPPSGFLLASAEVKTAGQPWTKVGKDTFTLTLSLGEAADKFHEAKFGGTLTPQIPGFGSGTITWDVSGKYRILGDHQGARDDRKRDPRGGLTTSKPGKGPTTEGKATHALTPVPNGFSISFVGTFTEEGSTTPFVGVHVRGTGADEATKTRCSSVHRRRGSARTGTTRT